MQSRKKAVESISPREALVRTERREKSDLWSDKEEEETQTRRERERREREKSRGVVCEGVDTGVKGKTKGEGVVDE